MYEHFVGTPNFMPPECIRNKASEKSSDMYSLGGVVFQMQTGFPPFLGKSEFLIFTQAEKQDPIFREEIWGDDQEEKLLKELVLLMMAKEMNARPSIEQVKAHPYFTGVDWSGKQLPTFEEVSKKFTEVEQYLTKLKARLLGKFDELNEKKEKVDEEFKVIAEELQELEIFDAPTKQKLVKRLALMKLQAYQFYNVEEFYWQDFVYTPPKETEEEKEK